MLWGKLFWHPKPTGSKPRFFSYGLVKGFTFPPRMSPEHWVCELVQFNQNQFLLHLTAWGCWIARKNRESCHHDTPWPTKSQGHNVTPHRISQDAVYNRKCLELGAGPVFVEDFECVTGGPVKQEILGVFFPHTKKTCENFSMHLFVEGNFGWIW